MAEERALPRSCPTPRACVPVVSDGRNQNFLLGEICVCVAVQAPAEQGKKLLGVQGGWQTSYRTMA